MATSTGKTAGTPAGGAAGAPAKRAPARASRAKTPAVVPSGPVGDWSETELAEVRSELEGQAVALRGEIDSAEAASESLKRDQSSEGSGDEADAGSKTFEREHEMSLANNSRDLLVQVERALGRLDAGTYGRCEECGQPIPKARLQAFPRATLCVTCKQREERR
jgi:RNA polymerase-binding protein DksA